ncbi:MAG: hypothetical protein DSZ03_07570 [Sulfurimonas sp.]|nr:MAG: hypothetical protein DSZ03_07570 [Sulfurimonas sp.]
MRIIALALLLLLATFISSNAKEATPSPIELIRPANKTLYVGENVTFVIQTNSRKIDVITLKQDNNMTTEIPVKPTKQTYCKTVPIHVGENNITVRAFEKGKVVAEVKRNLYFLSELFEGADEPEGYNRAFFHADNNENRCKACHDMTSNVPTNDEALEDVTQTTCYKCHQPMMRTKSTHAPAANWLCLDCHDGTVSEYNMEDKGKSKYLVRDPVAGACGKCHDTVEGWFMNRYTHGPVNDGRCIRCHNPHGSDNEFFLRKHIWDLCTTCHAEKATGKHIVSSFVFSRNRGAHPTKGPRDPARPERTFVCSSCHNPHGSSGIFLLRMKGSVPFNVCGRCHKKTSTNYGSKR